jgi:hypothetical protein
MLKTGSKVNLVVSRGPENSQIELSELVILNLPSKQEYSIGESFVSDGLVVAALYSDGSSKNVTALCSISGFESFPEGTKTLTVTYSEKMSRTVNFTINVKAPLLVPVDTSWQTDPLPPISGYWVETRNEYRYQNRETKSDTSPNIDGWTQYETKQEWGPWNGEWLAYDPGKSAARDTMTRQEPEYKTQIHYEHWKYWNASGNAYYYKGNTNLAGVSFTYEELQTDSPLQQYRSTSDGMSYWTGSGAIWFNPRDVRVQSGTRTEWQYRDMTTLYYFERWGAWSDWVEGSEPLSSGTAQNVESRVMYRYVAL